MECVDEEVAGYFERWCVDVVAVGAGHCVFSAWRTKGAWVVWRIWIFGNDARVYRNDAHSGAVRVFGDHGGVFGRDGAHRRIAGSCGGVWNRGEYDRCGGDGALRERPVYELVWESEGRGI